VNDDRAIRLLEEIRDLQRQHLENYKEGLRNQRESIELSRQFSDQAARRLKVTMIILIVLLVAFVLIRFWR